MAVRAQAIAGAGSVTNSQLANMAQSTIKGRAAGGGTGAPQDLTATQTNAILAGNTLQATPSNPTATTSTTGVMMGMGTTCTLTPTSSTRVFIQFTVAINNDTATRGAQAILRYGTGTAPANAAAVSGTTLGNITYNAAPAGVPYVPGTAMGIATGLTPGTAYWFDLSLAALTAGTATILNITCTAYEV